mgnify:CR=1 FL=1
MSEQRRKSRYTAESETELNAVAAENNNFMKLNRKWRRRVVIKNNF